MGSVGAQPGFSLESHHLHLNHGVYRTGTNTNTVVVYDFECLGHTAIHRPHSTSSGHRMGAQSFCHGSHDDHTESLAFHICTLSRAAPLPLTTLVSMGDVGAPGHLKPPREATHRH